MCIILSLHSSSCSRCPDFAESVLVCTYIHIHLHRETLKHVVMDVVNLRLFLKMYCVWIIHIVCFVKKSFAGCEEEGCLPCHCCCCPLLKGERDCSPAKGWPRGTSRGTPMAMTGDKEERGRNVGLEGNSGWKGPAVRSDHIAQGNIHLGLKLKDCWGERRADLQQSLWNDGEKENCHGVPEKSLLRCYFNSGSHGKSLN